MTQFILNDKHLKRITFIVGLISLFYFQGYSQNKTFNVYGGSSLTAVFGNQFNYYQPTELLNQIDLKISKIIKMFMPIGKRFDSLEKNLISIKMDEINKFQNPFLLQIKEDSILISKKNIIIDSLILSSKERDKYLIEAKDLIYQSQAVNKSSKVLLETNKLITIKQDNHIVYGFNKSDIANNKNLITVFYQNENDSTIVVRKFNRYGFINRSGNLIINFKYELAENFQNNLAVVVQGGKYGFIDKKDVIKIPFEYDFALSFRKGRALVSKDNKWYFINENGKKVGKIKDRDDIILSARYLENKNRICLHCKEHEYLLSKKGKYISYLSFPRHFLYIFEYLPFRQIFELGSSRNYKIQYSNGNFGLVNYKLKSIPKSYTYSSDFTFDLNNYAIVKNKTYNPFLENVKSGINIRNSLGTWEFVDRKYNLINIHGTEMLAKHYDFIGEFSFSAYPININRKWGLLDSTLIEKVKCEFDSIAQLSKNVTLVLKIKDEYLNDTLPLVKKYGVIDEYGFSFIPLCFKKIEFVENKYFIVSYNDTFSKLELVKDFDKVDAKCLTNCDAYNSFVLSQQ